VIRPRPKRPLQPSFSRTSLAASTMNHDVRKESAPVQSHSTKAALTVADILLVHLTVRLDNSQTVTYGVRDNGCSKSDSRLALCTKERKTLILGHDSRSIARCSGLQHLRAASAPDCVLRASELASSCTSKYFHVCRQRVCAKRAQSLKCSYPEPRV